MEEVNFYEATLVTCDNVGDSKEGEIGDKLKHTKTVEFTVIRSIYCTVDVERGNAINLANGAVYHIVQRDVNGNIKREELGKLSTDNLVVFAYYEKNLGLVQNAAMKERAKEVYANYLSNINEIEEPRKSKR